MTIEQQPEHQQPSQPRNPVVWVDADACPNAIKDILFKAAKRTEIHLWFVANRYFKVPPSPFIHFKQVQQGFDVADNEIAQSAEQDDLVVTSDIPLAAEVIEKKANAISFRGDQYKLDSIRAKLNMRDFMDSMRSSGVEMTGGQAPFGDKDKQSFANSLDVHLAKMKKLQK